MSLTIQKTHYLKYFRNFLPVRFPMQETKTRIFLSETLRILMWEFQPMVLEKSLHVQEILIAFFGIHALWVLHNERFSRAAICSVDGGSEMAQKLNCCKLQEKYGTLGCERARSQLFLTKPNFRQKLVFWKLTSAFPEEHILRIFLRSYRSLKFYLDFERKILVDLSKLHSTFPEELLGRKKLIQNL